jgi:hypothetical protein
MANTAYSPSFYIDQRTGSQKSAEIILPIVFDLIKPNNVVDVGCGVGTWLKTAAHLGAKCTLGFEGKWLENAPAGSDDFDIQLCDLEDKIVVPAGKPAKYDVAMCLEVAEHLSERRAPSLIGDLCELSDVVLFSAALPGQGGTDHINEQWQSYWADHFRRFGFRPYDVVRPVVWTNPDVELWYRQNMLLYVHDRAVHLVSNYQECTMLNVVHQGVYAYSHPPSPRYLIKQFPAALRRAANKRIAGKA